MDLIALAVAAVGLMLASIGMPVAGGTLYAASLIGFPVLLATRRGLHLVLPFSFRSYLIAFVVAIVALVVLARRAQVASVAVFGLTFYYYVCVSLVERKVRYVPMFRTLWKVAHRDQRPKLYWWHVGLAFAFAAASLAIAYVLVAKAGRVAG